MQCCSDSFWWGRGPRPLAADGHVKRKVAPTEADGPPRKRRPAKRLNRPTRNEGCGPAHQAIVSSVCQRGVGPPHLAALGRRFDSLLALSPARELADELKLPIEDYTRLRSEAISRTLSLADLQATSRGTRLACLARPGRLSFRGRQGLLPGLGQTEWRPGPPDRRQPHCPAGPGREDRLGQRPGSAQSR